MCRSERSTRSEEIRGTPDEQFWVVGHQGLRRPAEPRAVMEVREQAAGKRRKGQSVG